MVFGDRLTTQSRKFNWDSELSDLPLLIITLMLGFTFHLKSPRNDRSKFNWNVLLCLKILPNSSIGLILKFKEKIKFQLIEYIPRSAPPVKGTSPNWHPPYSVHLPFCISPISYGPYGTFLNRPLRNLFHWEYESRNLRLIKISVPISKF